MAEFDSLVKRAERSFIKRDQFVALMRDAYGFAQPERDSWTSYGYGQNRMARVFNSTAIAAAGRFTNRVQQALFPPQQRWCQLAPDPSLPPELVTSEAQHLEAATERLFSHIRVSNFDLAISEWGQDLLAGTAVMMIENGRRGGRPYAPLLRCRVIPSGHIGLDDGPDGSVEGIFIEQKQDARLVQRAWPDAKLPAVLTKLAEDQPEAEVSLLLATVYEPEERKWCLHVLHKESKTVMLKRYSITQPFICTRWSKAPGEDRGRGPLLQALPDIRTANKVVEGLLRGQAFTYAPITLARHDGVLNPSTVRLVPGAVIPVASTGGPMGASLAPFPMPQQINTQQIVLGQLETSIRQIMFDSPLPPEVQAGLTATEVVERVRQFQADTGAFGRLQAEAVIPMVRRMIDVLEEAGEFSDPQYAGLAQLIDDGQIRIVPVSPLAQVQNRADVSAVMDLLRMAGGMGEYGQAVLQNSLKLNEVGPFLAQKLGVPAHLIPTAEDLAQVKAEQQQQQQLQQVLSSPVAAQVAGQLAGGAVQAAQPQAEATQ
ncbi:Head-to-tail connector protein, podovirus-type [uncultured Caudovirales phage]|uniref:Head-to-tail connector protein, podovirus-type n=1 Tax=uncultured Caudovirales phage TaxID=2100421 RepID=A0A6J5L252_9CAUD|nr:Head-to-tail connector protein, podovirus-type [uncultured Caudovirales phage]